MVEQPVDQARYAVIDAGRARPTSPHVFDTLLEGVRTASEAATLSLTWGLLHTPRSARSAQAQPVQPVLVLPGFMGGDSSTVVLRRFLSNLGYDTHPWRLGTNNGTQRLQNALVKRFVGLRRRYGRPIALVGHSLGGVFARELARQFPGDVSQVVTLGSPFAIADAQSVNGLVRLLFEQVSGDSVEDKRTSMLRADPSRPVGIPCTSIYSRSDGVVHWRACLEQQTDITQNLEVWGSHCGMVVNSSVLHAVADRLAQPHGEWRRFDASRGRRSYLYPRDKAIYA